ncbi:MAG: SprT family zinc-dependent metalloprotease [Ottowia sp.]|uniref:M48 family metallopeptidase n=1 Tax=Ottowia sp. TaxID=1898956 RepID=UPI0039E228F1
MRQMLLGLFEGDAEASEPNRPPAPARQASAATETIVSEPPVALGDALAPARFAHPRANRAIVLGQARVAYLLRRGQRRTIGFSVGADGLTVSAPRWTTLGEIDAALREKQRWIVAKLDESRERQQRLEAARIDWREGASVPFLGEPVVLRLDPRQRHGRGGAVLDAGDGAPTLHLGLPHGATPEQLRDTTQAWLMRQARRVFTARLDHFAPRLGVRWQKLSLSSAGTRWGSASADGSIRLNWRLIHFREPTIDYVVVHELAHLREMNHGPRFWQHVQDVLPDYAELRGELRDEAVPRW